MTERERPTRTDGGFGAAQPPVIDTGRRAVDLSPAKETGDNRTPTAMVIDAFRRTKTANGPYKPEHQDSGSFRSALIGKLGLASSERDGRGLEERFIDADTRDDLPAVLSDLDKLSAAVTSIISTAHEEIDQRVANSGGPLEPPSEARVLQRQVVRDLVAVAARQFERETPEAQQRTQPATVAELQVEGEASNAHIDPFTSELLMMAPDSILGDEFREIRQMVFEHEFTSSVVRHAGTAQDALVVARTIQRALGFAVDEGVDGRNQFPQAKVFIERNKGAALEPYAIEGLDTLSSEDRHEELATAMGAEGDYSLGNYWLQYPEDQEPHRLAPITV